MLCEKCGKPFQGAGTLCDECAAGTTPEVPAEAPATAEPHRQTSLAQNQQSVSQTPVAEVPVQQAVPAEETPLVLSAPTAPVKKEKKRNVKRIAIIAAILALVGGTCFFFFFTDAGKYMTSSPEEYLQDVQQEQISTYIDGATAVYGTMLKTADEPMAANSELRLQVNDPMFELAETFTGTPADDMQFLKDVRLGVDNNIVDSTLQTGLRLALGDTEIVQGDVLMDMVTSRIYMSVPELNSQYLASTISQTSDVGSVQQKAAWDQLREDLPSEREMNKFLNSLSETALAEIVNVQGAEEIVAINDITEKQHVLTATLTEGDTLRISRAILEKAQSDDTFKQLLQAVSSYNLMMGSDEDLYAQVMDEITVGISDLTTEINSATTGQTFLVKTYVNHSGEITGRIVTIFGNGPEQEVMRVLSASNGSVTYIQGNVENYYISGQMQTSGKVATAHCVFTEDATEMFTLDVTATRRQSTEIQLTPGRGMIDLLMAEAGISTGSGSVNPISGILAGSISFRVTISDPDADVPVVSMRALLNNKTLFTLSLTAREAEAQSITIPQTYAAAENTAEAERWLENTDFDIVIDRLRAAGVPERYLDLIRDIIP